MPSPVHNAENTTSPIHQMIAANHVHVMISNQKEFVVFLILEVIEEFKGSDSFYHFFYKERILVNNKIPDIFLFLKKTVVNFTPSDI